jgi:hypothetical protein
VKFIPLFLALCTLIACKTEKYPEAVAAGNTKTNSITSAVQQERNPVAPSDCKAPKEGQYQTFGNSNVRYGNICIDQVYLSFMATGEFTMSFGLDALDCKKGEQLSWKAPFGFYERTVPDQIRILERSLTENILKLSAECKIDLDPARFLGPRFADFYYAFGDGLWFTRLENGIVLTPKKGSGHSNAK